MSPRNFLRGDTEKFENRSKSPDLPRNHTQLIKTHKKQVKYLFYFSFIFKFPTDWGACDQLYVGTLEF